MYTQKFNGNRNRNRNRSSGGSGGNSSNNNGGNRNRSSRLNTVLESNGPEVKVRGTAHQIFEKYVALTRDNSATGDRVVTESYMQFAEHYYRLITASGAAYQGNATLPERYPSHLFDEDEEDEQEDLNEVSDSTKDRDLSDRSDFSGEQNQQQNYQSRERDRDRSHHQGRNPNQNENQDQNQNSHYIQNNIQHGGQNNGQNTNAQRRNNRPHRDGGDDRGRNGGQQEGYYRDNHQGSRPPIPDAAAGGVVDENMNPRSTTETSAGNSINESRQTFRSERQQSRHDNTQRRSRQEQNGQNGQEYQSQDAPKETTREIPIDTSNSEFHFRSAEDVKVEVTVHVPVSVPSNSSDTSAEGTSRAVRSSSAGDAGTVQASLIPEGSVTTPPRKRGRPPKVQPDAI